MAIRNRASLSECLTLKAGSDTGSQTKGEISQATSGVAYFAESAEDSTLDGVTNSILGNDQNLIIIKSPRANVDKTTGDVFAFLQAVYYNVSTAKAIDDDTGGILIGFCAEQDGAASADTTMDIIFDGQLNAWTA